MDFDNSSLTAVTFYDIQIYVGSIDDTLLVQHFVVNSSDCSHAYQCSVSCDSLYNFYNIVIIMTSHSMWTFGYLTGSNHTFRLYYFKVHS